MELESISNEAKDRVWDAYEALSEKLKRTITRHTAKNIPKLFNYWVRAADLARGCDQRMVQSREGNYGVKLDKVLKNYEDGRLAADVFASFLMKTGIIDSFLSDIPDNLDRKEFERFVDAKASKMESDYSAFLSAFLKCYPPKIFKKSSAADTTKKEMMELVSRLDEHAEKLEEWATLLRLIKNLPLSEFTATVKEANIDVVKLTGQIRYYCKKTGFSQRDFKTSTDVKDYIEGLCTAIAGKIEKDEVAGFMKSLVEALRSLRITHRSASKQTRLSLLRDQAASEVESFVASEELKWLNKTDQHGINWLRYMFEIGGDELEVVKDQLKADGYERLSEFIEIGEVEWIIDELISDGLGNKPDEAPVDEAGVEKPATGESVKDEDEIESAKVLETLTTDKVSGPTAKTVPNENLELSTEARDQQEISDQKTEMPTEENSDLELVKETINDAEKTKLDTDKVPVMETYQRKSKAGDWEGKDIPEVAKVVADAGEKAPAGSIAALAGKLAQQGEYALAYHLISNASLLLDMKGTIPAWVYGSVACGRAKQGTDQSMNTLLLGFFQQYQEQLFDMLEATDRMAVHLLLAAGSFEPALFFPITGAASILQTLKFHKLPGFNELVSAVADYGSRGVGLPRAALFSTISADELKQKRDAVQAKAKEWLDRAPQFEIISRPGKETWRAWIAKNGPVGSMLNPVISGRTTEIQEIRALAEKYASSASVDLEARKLFRHSLDHRGELLRPALNMIRRHTVEAIELVDEWISVVESQPDCRQRFDEKMLAQLRKCFADNSKQALAELEDMSSKSWPAAICAGAIACMRVVNDITRVLQGIGTQSDPIRTAHQLLHDDLLRVSRLQLNADGTPRLPYYLIPTNEEETSKELARRIVNGIASITLEGLPTMQSAARMRGEKGDHESTSEILKLLEVIESPDSLKRLETERTNSISKHREPAKNQLMLGQRALSDALTKGLFAAQEYERWAVQLGSAERDMHDLGFLGFADVFLLCERLNEELKDRKTREIARLRKDIDRINPNDEQRTRLNAVLNGGDVHTATDYLDRIRNQIELPDVKEAVSTPFIQFFGKNEESACELIERELKETNAPIDFVNRVANRKQVAGLQLDEMQTTQASKAAEFLQLWFKTKKARELKEPNGSSIFSFFGMRTEKMVKASQFKGNGNRGDVWDLQVETLESRDVCPWAGFGSGANGNYKVIGYWLRPAAEDILQHARQLGGGPVIVLYFGRMNMIERRNLAAEQGRGDVIVIDDILAVFLAGQRKERLLSLFLCSLPFSHISPYTKVASLLPPEMFYGRHREIRQLMSDGTDSSCLLYGGRQIGKTVLLRHVQRIFERGEPYTNVATYIDLKGKEIGTNRPMDEVWLVIAEELAKKKVINEQILRQMKHDWLFTRIEGWLGGDSKRRILILLDEADAFLTADAKGQDSKVPFSACTVLKDLMERTNRRFKLVFAGLHNVQKATKVSNNPLAHFGEPICIGAMTDAGESREAEALITEPLAAAGYFFESADLPARILAQTNYYPNLIQIYCDELLKYMQQRSRVLFPSGRTPPYIIGAKILEDVYERHELREELRLRFKWTLELDRRFELIANILALNDVDCTRGLKVAEIQDNAHDYWDRGFSSDGKPLTYEGFRDLLEEMVGLGILRRAEPPDHYALRNPNVLNLIGSRSAVERLLEDAHKWDPVEVYDPTKFRGQISEHDKALRSPLNAAQESKLKSGINQVCIVCGCLAGHVDRVEQAIIYRFGKDGFVRVLQGHENLSHFQSELSKLGDRKSGGTTLIVVPDSLRWDRNWIVESCRRVSRFTKAKGAVCVVFVTGPTRLHSIVPDIVRRKFEGVNLLSVQPWDDSTVNQWLQEGGHNAIDALVRAKLADITGNWPVLLEEAVKLVKRVDGTENLGKKVKDGIFRPERKRDLYDLFGLFETTVAPLKFLCENGSGWSLEEISELLGDGEANISIEHVTNALTWAELLGLARRGPDGWELDAGVRQVLSMD